MKSNKIKNIFLTLSIASLAVLLVVIPATLTLYGEKTKAYGQVICMKIKKY